jgi:putative tricarboxylic transport membrane protein
MKTKDIYTGIFLLLFAGAIFVLILQSPSPPESSGPSPFFLPAITALVIGGLSLALIIQSLRPSDKKAAPPGGKRMWNRLIWIVLWCFLYAFTIEKLGYLLSTGVVTLALLAYFNRRRWVLNVVFSLVTPLSIYILFDTLLKVPLPKGWFGF